MEEAQVQHDEITRGISCLLCNVRDWTNHIGIVTPAAHNDHDDREKYNLKYTGRNGAWIAISSPQRDSDLAAIPAYICGSDREWIRQGCSHIFTYLRRSFTIAEQMELLLEILKWFEDHILPLSEHPDTDVPRLLKDLNSRLSQAFYDQIPF
jgi:hypothetical protein